MTSTETLQQIDLAIQRLRAVGWRERDAVRDQLIAVARESTDLEPVRAHLASVRPKLPLELRWEIDEVLDAIAPPPEPEPEITEEEPADKPLSASDLNLVYDDPRGLMLHKSKVGDRWFATQRDPNTGQPQTFELQTHEVQQLKGQLKGSPYWLIGSGEAPGV
ncbi:MAG: hypothetical protein JRI25_08205 [Deltaproteobacteria bacterium]|nr:hypothetical protein [Deltaproteobacteria bacterium]MBW2254567.1 hypothetical protein [Deltaproteobacteria bacterium]